MALVVKRALICSVIALLCVYTSVLAGKSEILFSVQIATFADIERAENFISEFVPKELAEQAFIYVTDRGLVTVRIGLDRSPSGLKHILAHIKGVFNDAFIVPTDPKKVNHLLYPEEPDNLQKAQAIARTLPAEDSQKPFIREFEELIARLRSLVDRVFYTKGDTTTLLSYPQKREDERLKLLRQREKLLSRKLPLYLTGEIRLRTRPFYEDDTPRSRGFGYIGIRFSLFEEGIGELRYKKARERFKLQLYRELELSGQLYELFWTKQVKTLRELLLKEKIEVERSRANIVLKLEELLTNLGKIDAQFAYLKRKYLSYVPYSLGGKPTEQVHMPVISIDIEKLIFLASLRERAVREGANSLVNSLGGDLGSLRDYRLDLYVRYYLIDTGGLDSYLALGARAEIPIPFDRNLRKDVNKLEAIALRNQLMEKMLQNHSNALDYAFRMLNNSERIREHLRRIHRDLLEIERELFFWKFGIKEVNYDMLLENLLGIYDRLSQVINYKYLNIQYAQKIVLLLNLRKEEVRELFYEGL